VPLDRGEKIAEGHAVAPRFDHQPLRILLEQRPARGRVGGGAVAHHRADAGPDRQELLLDEQGDNPVRGVGIDLERLTELADGRKRVAGAQLTADDGAAHGIHDLLVDRLPGPQRDGERQHRRRCTSYTSTPTLSRRALD